MINVCITGGAGRIAYALIPFLLDGNLFNSKEKVNLRLLDIKGQEERLNGLEMEINDSLFSNCASVTGTTDAEVAFDSVDVAILLGGFPRLKGMERADLIEKNVATLLPQAEALNKYAKRDCLVVVVANPANTNCLVALSVASSLPPENFSALTRLDHERLRGIIAAKAGAKNQEYVGADVHNVAIYGNHSGTQVPFMGQATLHIRGTRDNVMNVTDVIDDTTAQKEVIPRVQKRGAEVIGALGASSALSAAQAVRKHVAGLLLGDARGNPAADATTAEGDSFSMACMLPKNTRVADDGSDVGAAVMPADLVFSVPYGFDSATGVVQPIIWPVPASALADTTQELLEEAWTARRIVEDMEIRIRDDCGLCNVPSPAARL